MYNGAESYFENGVLSADPVELVRMLYRGGIDAVEKAREHLSKGDIAARSAQITRAGAIVAHLTFSVNRDVDPVMGANLVELYDYMQRRLLRANLDQADGPLAEVSRLLSTMLDGWAACGPIEAGAVRTTPTWAHAEPAPVEVAPVETASAGVYGQTAGGGLYSEPAGGGLYGQTVGAGAYGQTGGAGAYAEPAGGLFGQTAGAGAYVQAVDTSVYAEAGPAETAGAGANAEPAGAGLYGRTLDGSVYSQTVGAGAYAPTTGAGAYRQTVAGGYGDQEPEVEYAGSKSWDF